MTISPWLKEMKHIFAIFIFLVTWDQYELKRPCNEENFYIGKSSGAVIVNPICNEFIYTVETVKHTIKLKTQSDVNTFIPHHVGDVNLPGMIPGAFNVTVKEEKE